MYRYRRLRDLRDDHDMVQKQVAAVLGTSQKQYSRWETGTQRNPCASSDRIGAFLRRNNRLSAWTLRQDGTLKSPETQKSGRQAAAFFHAESAPAVCAFYPAVIQ